MQNKLVMDDLHYWEQHAEIFDSFIGEEGDSLRKEILDPFLIKHIDPKKTDTLLDAGCGNGYLTRKLAPKIEIIVGIDGAQAMIDIAREKSGKSKNISYAQQDLTKTPWNFTNNISTSNSSHAPDHFPPYSFSHIVAHLVLQDLDGLEVVLQECYNHLRTGGFLHITIPHPFTSPPVGKYHMGIAGRMGFSNGYLKVYNYLEERQTKRHIYLQKQINHNYYHRTISTYLNLLIKHNFHIETTQEVGTDKTFIHKYPQYAHGRMIPIFLYIKAKK